MTSTRSDSVLLALPADVRDRCQHVLKRIAGHGRGCAHLERDPIAFACIMHPQVARCRECMNAHAVSHTRHEEYGCDLCGELLEDGGDRALFLHHPVEVDTTVSIGRGRRAVVGIVQLFGWGACSKCVPIIDPAAN